MTTVPAITEREFQNNVIELATIYGWRVAHFRPAQTKRGWRTPMQGSPGFPDLVLARHGRVIFAELKSESGKLTDDQRAWLEALKGRDNWPEVFVWRPSDMDQINKVLGPG